MKKSRFEKFRLTDAPSLDELPLAGIIPKPSTSREYKTGDWRNFRPILDKSKCTRCSLCWVYCPDAAVTRKDDDTFEVDLMYCKGCGVCAEECPSKAIKMVEESEK